jgi:DNA-binding CsgD family transcriptional regulator
MAKLSGRQRQIVGLLVAGQSQQEIARGLGISYQTVRKHLSEARARTAARSSLELAVRAAQENAKP